MKFEQLPTQELLIFKIPYDLVITKIEALNQAIDSINHLE